MPGRDELEPVGCRLRRREPDAGRADHRHRRSRRARRPRDGDPERAQLPGLARGIPPHGSARALRVVRGARDRTWRASIASLNVLLTSTCWRNDHNGFSHQGPGLIDIVLSKKGTVARIYLPPDANCLLSVADHCLRSRDHVNLIVIDKQPQLQWLDMDAAREHPAR